ncbi:hypothetical protein [Mycolicibacterium goodii]|uniref:hypothetical protein n=1 Tax=Mycolicibacterium goodii TaxID=134601 RepID=UPI00093B0644|nr:hypothetical protein [Mycolicibacterium goodii]OKH72989.1 hypothetical protein EB74_22335 [Mycobacterium sp. SWH-M5]MBU8812450.1 hypothetical protein [Mycolicibacterium goodii]MBU8816650.1 hypothetical protein [Mycolicibacterium goodii]MBU8828795.1 hypothetical protein [Mycolicibacterium goodii]PJK23073.1 hypothetical protein CSX11_07650 [Mycolicibacterium goodii]
MPGAHRLVDPFAKQKLMKKIVTSALVATGVGGAALVCPPAHRPASVAVEQRPPIDAVASAAVDTTPAPVVTPAPVAVTKDSNAEAIVKAIVSQGQAHGLSDDQIKTVIATAKIESSFRPTVSGGVQAYGGKGTRADEVIGLFQEKASFGSVEERQDPAKAIDRFIARFTDAFRRYGTNDSVLAATLAQNPQLRKHHGGIGTHYYNTVKAAMSTAADLYRQATGATM